MALVAEKFSGNLDVRGMFFGAKIYSKEEVLQWLPELISQMTRAGFSAEAQSRYVLSSREMGVPLGEFLRQSPALIASLIDNGLRADQIDGVLSKVREDKIRDENYWGQAARRGQCVILGFSVFDVSKIFPGLEILKGSDWTPKQKTEFLLKIRLSGSGMEKFSAAFPTVKAWVANEGWTTAQAVSYLTALSLSYSKFDPVDVRLILARSGFDGASQAQLLTDLVDSRVYRAQNAEPQFLEPFLHFLKARSWSTQDVFDVLSRVAKNCGDATFSQLPALGDLIRTLEHQNWSPGEVKDLVFAFTENSSSSPKDLFYTLKGYIPWLEAGGWGRPDILWFLKQLSAKTQDEFHAALGVFRGFSAYTLPGEQFSVAKQFMTIMDNCNPYNRAQVLNLLRDQGALFREMGREHFSAHLEFYAAIMARWPRIGYSVMSNLMEATMDGIVPKDIASSRESILKFIERTHGFNSVHYQAYLVEGDGFLAQINEYAQRILDEDFSIQDAQALVRKYDRSVPGHPRRGPGHGYMDPDYRPPSEGQKFLLGLIQRVSPTSGVSFARDGQIGDLLRKVLQAGDLRSHIPAAWRGLVSTFEMSRGAMDLKPGEQLDPQGNIKSLLEQFRFEPGEQEPSHGDLAEAMVAYLVSGRDPAEGQRLRQILFKRAAASEELREKLAKITELDFTSLTILEEIFSDADSLPKFLKEAFDHVPRGRGLVTQMGAVGDLVGDAEGLVKQIKKLAQNRKMPAERRKEILTNLLKVYKPEGVRLKILSRPDLPQEMKQEIEAVMGEKPDLTPREIIEELLQEPRRRIEAEKNKFQFQNQGVQKIGLRAVKGPAFGLHGFLSGVCIAPDIELWKDPNFKLLAITDENESQALGYIHVYEKVIMGKKYLTLPGINPSAEYVGAFNRKQSEELFKKLMVGVREFAEAGGYEGVYIPTSSGIHSNRGYIQEAIQKAGYPTKAMPEVNWNHLPSPYPFSEVYVVWEDKGEAVPGK
ncbi:MAG: hypothetical protein K8R69_01815 [Deltaproteobacteria bacterium]|nr:hypothetical protein [Deltaproteobacteria bacterium]